MYDIRGYWTYIRQYLATKKKKKKKRKRLMWKSYLKEEQYTSGVFFFYRISAFTKVVSTTFE